MRQQSFHPVCQKCYPRVYMNSLRDVGFTRDITWRETFFEPWRKNFDLFLKTAFYVSKGKFWVKTTFFESSVFFKFFRTLNEHLLCLARKFSERDIKIEKCSFRLIISIKKSNIWKFSFFSNSSELRTNNYRARRKSFQQGYQNWKLQFSSHNVNKKNQTFGSSFFSNSSETWTNIYRAWRKTFRQGYQNWKLQSSCHKINQKLKLLKVLFFFKFFRTFNAHFPCLAEKISAGLSKLKIAVFVS